MILLRILLRCSNKRFETLVSRIGLNIFESCADEYLGIKKQLVF